MDVFELLAKISLDTSEYDNALDGASGKTSGFASKLGSGLKTAAKVGAAGIAAVTSAVGILSKASLDSYSDYEQLTGGVETLFKTSADVVMEYANNAYKTAGLSANQYMETVTSFSASLLQSLGGDTYAAAKYADMAITDMADNANKMGTAIDSIQNAYQGFAKQNFTMLDNLKLGYGGTKEEMERLLADAEMLSGIKYDISSYADIVDAIHVVQTEIGITGTTAKEAASTIQGSVSAAKSAWKNLVTGIGNENADLSSLVTQFVDSVITASDNILPRLEQIFSGAVELIRKLVPAFADVIPGMVESILPSLLDAGMELVSMLKQGILDGIPTLADAALEGSKAIGEGLEENMPTLLQNMIKFVYQLAQTLMDNAPKFLEAAATIVKGLLDGLVEYLPTLLEWIPFALKGFAETLSEHLPDIIDLGVQLVTALAGALIEAIPILLEAFPDIIAAVGEAALDIGKALLEGVWNGITSIGQWLMDQIKGFFDGIVEGVKDLLGIHSPSRVFAGIGENMALGLGNGWDDEFSAVRKDIEGGMNFGTATMDFETSGLGQAGRTIAGGIIAASAASSDDNSGRINPIDVTLTLDGAVLARKLFDYSQSEDVRRGSRLVPVEG